jgi:ribosomal protein S6
VTHYNIYSLDTPLPDAIAHFERKHGVTPNVVRMHPVNAGKLRAEGVRVIEDESVLKWEYWLGRKGSKK